MRFDSIKTHGLNCSASIRYLLPIEPLAVVPPVLLPCQLGILAMAYGFWRACASGLLHTIAGAVFVAPGNPESISARREQSATEFPFKTIELIVTVASVDVEQYSGRDLKPLTIKAA